VIVATTPFEALLNVGHPFVDDEGVDRFRFQPIVSEGVILPTSYEGKSGGGLWKFYLAQETFALVQARLIGVAYWQKPVGSGVRESSSAAERPQALGRNVCCARTK
jgi:hypothetical protein